LPRADSKVVAGLGDKARELEAELELYRVENTALRNSRRQQEATLAEMIQQRNELTKWAAEEKKRTEEFCEEQRQAASRERRAVAKQAREAREKEQISTRKDRAEIEGLQATIEKLKLDLDKSTKKYRATEKRLSQLLKESSDNIEQLEKQAYLLEQEKLDIWSLLEGSSLATSLRKRLTQLKSRRSNGSIADLSSEEVKRLRKTLAEKVVPESRRPYGHTYAG
jgi:hypothetical protein